MITVTERTAEILGKSIGKAIVDRLEEQGYLAEVTNYVSDFIRLERERIPEGKSNGTPGAEPGVNIVTH